MPRPADSTVPRSASARALSPVRTAASTAIANASFIGSGFPPSASRVSQADEASCSAAA